MASKKKKDTGIYFEDANIKNQASANENAGTQDPQPKGMTSMPETNQEPVQEPAQEPEVQVVTPEEQAIAEAPAADTAEATEDSADGQDAAEEPAEVDSWEAKIEGIKANGTRSEKNVVNALEGYVVKMAPYSVLTQEAMIAQQMLLWRTVRNVIEEPKDFEAGYTLLIDYARQYKNTSFSDHNLYRMMDQIPLDKESAKYFQASLNVITIAASVKNRKDAVKQVDLNRVMNERVFSEVGRNNVINYFS